MAYNIKKKAVFYEVVDVPDMMELGVNVWSRETSKRKARRKMASADTVPRYQVGLRKVTIEFVECKV